jgi:hypothetical protein
VPQAVGYDKDFEGDETFFQSNGESSYPTARSSILLAC